MQRLLSCVVFIVVMLFMAVGCSTPRAMIVEYGVFEAKAANRVEAVGTSLKHVVSLEDLRLIDITDTPVAEVGLRFGIRYRLTGNTAESNVVNIRLKHPPVKNPDTRQTSTIERWEQKMRSGALTYAGFTMDSEWEMVPGEWTFEIWLKDEKLAEKSFTVTRR